MEIKLHLKGTDFQIKVWETLLKIPMGKVVTYGNIAKEIQNANASRAVGTAVGDNPVAFFNSMPPGNSGIRHLWRIPLG